jgi:hypothetical protein
VRRGMFEDFGDDLFHGHLRAFRMPRGIHGVAPIAAQITAGRADKNGGDAGELAFALNRIKYFGDEHQAGLGGSGPALR